MCVLVFHLYGSVKEKYFFSKTATRIMFSFFSSYKTIRDEEKRIFKNIYLFIWKLLGQRQKSDQQREGKNWNQSQQRMSGLKQSTSNDNNSYQQTLIKGLMNVRVCKCVHVLMSVCFFWYALQLTGCVSCENKRINEGLLSQTF